MSQISAKYLTVEAAAVVLGLSEDSIRARIARRTLPFRKLRGRILIPVDDLDAHIRALEGVSAKEATANASQK
jgi:excisionase family DNA binding protein